MRRPTGDAVEHFSAHGKAPVTGLVHEAPHAVQQLLLRGQRRRVEASDLGALYRLAHLVLVAALQVIQDLVGELRVLELLSGDVSRFLVLDSASSRASVKSVKSGAHSFATRLRLSFVRRAFFASHPRSELLKQRHRPAGGLLLQRLLEHDALGILASFHQSLVEALGVGEGRQ